MTFLSQNAEVAVPKVAAPEVEEEVYVMAGNLVREEAAREVQATANVPGEGRYLKGARDIERFFLTFKSFFSTRDASPEKIPNSVKILTVDKSIKTMLSIRSIREPISSTYNYNRGSL